MKIDDSDKEEVDEMNIINSDYDVVSDLMLLPYSQTKVKIDDSDKEEVDEMNIINNDYDAVSNIDALS